jgi:hypothetical protein
LKRVFLLLVLFCLTLAVESRPVHAEGNVIYGSSTGLPLDATIRQVSFSRSGDNLITTFQVKGQISGVYSYQIVILLSSSSDPDDFAYKILTYPSSLNDPPAFYNEDTDSKTPIQYTIQGDTWTATIPLSLMDGTLQFWVWVGVTSGCYYDTCNWVDMLPSDPSAPNYEIRLPVKVTFTVEPNSIADGVTLTVDRTGNRFQANGRLSVMLGPESDHDTSITPAINKSSGIRYLLRSWSDSKSGDSSRKISFDEDASVTVTYVRQFMLTVNPGLGRTNGTGWYDEGSNPTIFVSPTQLPYDGVLGTLGLQHQFAGWSGDVVSNYASTPVTMDGPKVAQANWKTAAAPTFFIFIGLIVGVLLVTVFLIYRRRNRAVALAAHNLRVMEGVATGNHVGKPGANGKVGMFCSKCGAKIDHDSKFCSECGASTL